MCMYLCYFVIGLLFLNVTECVITWTNPPIGSQDGSGSFSVYENIGENELVVTVDATPATWYSIVNQQTQQTPYQAEKVYINNSVIGDVYLTAGLFFDFETQPTYEFTIIAVDGVYTGTATITLNILDVEDDPYYYTTGAAFVRVPDGTNAGTTVHTPVMTLPSTTTLQISCFYYCGNTDFDFQYGSQSNVLQTQNSLSRSRTPSYTLVLQAIANSMTSTTTVVICVGDEYACYFSGADISAICYVFNILVVLTLLIFI